MPSLLIKNIQQLVGVREQSPLLRGAALAQLPVIDNAWLLIEDDTIAAFGSMDDFDTTHHPRSPPMCTMQPVPAYCPPGAIAIHTSCLLPAAKKSLYTRSKA